jgi:hypothetical protein
MVEQLAAVLVAMFEVVATFEGNDREFYEGLVEDWQQFVWQVNECSAICKFGVMNVSDLAALFDSWGDEISVEELDEINSMLFGQVIELNRGRGCVYELARVV